MAVGTETACAAKEVYLREHITSLDESIARLEGASNGLHALADRLLGSTPEDENKATVQACPEGLIGECQDRQGQLTRVTDSILFALERLQQAA